MSQIHTTTSFIVVPAIFPMFLIRASGSRLVAARRARLGLTENGVLGDVKGVGKLAL